MVVVNIVGFHYKLKLRSGEIVIPYDGQPHEVPDEVAESKFDNVFKVLVPPKPKYVEQPIVIQTVNELKKAPEIIKIDTKESVETKIEAKIENVPLTENNEEIKKPPLKGIKIKKGTREKLIKKGKSKPKTEEVTNGNN